MRWLTLVVLGHVVALGVGVGAYAQQPVGWFRADNLPSLEDAYDERFEPLAIGEEGGPCEAIAARQGDATHPIMVLVPGIGGDGDEMQAALPEVMKARPASVYMFRYRAFEPGDEAVDRLAVGLSRLAACIPHGTGRLLVFAHSAGGVLGSRAVAKVKPPRDTTGQWLTLITVASPLAGTNQAPASYRVPAQRALMLELGTKIASYPPPVEGVRVVHLRSSPKSDFVMLPTRGHSPNDPGVGSPHARQLDLPDHLGHDAAYVYAAQRIGDGSYVEWLAADGPT